MKFLILICVFLLSACATPEQRLENQRREIERKHQMFSSMPEIYVCGKYYKFEHFTGKREFINKSDIAVATRVIGERKIKCDNHYVELLKINGANAFAYIETQDRKRKQDDLESKIEANERNLRNLENQQRTLEINRMMEEANKKIRRY